MKKLTNAIGEFLKNFFTDDDPNVIWIQIPRKFKTKKDQNYMIRHTKNFIIEKTEIE